jgi:AGZA family xanthine/uracil permease-like MFS transporter
VCPHTAADPTCDNDVEYMQCVNIVRRDIVTATAAIAAFTSVRDHSAK